jgi:hypothetical protein
MTNIKYSKTEKPGLYFYRNLERRFLPVVFISRLKKTYFKNYIFSFPKKEKFLIKTNKHKISNFLIDKNTNPDKITSIEIGNQKSLPFGTFSHLQKLTDKWNLKNRWKWLAEENELIWGDLEVSIDNLKVMYRAFGGSDEDSAAIRGNLEIFKNNPINYFEIKVLNTGREGFIGIGLAHYYCDLDRLPGWEMYSFGYHGDDGHLFDCSGTGKKYGPRFSKGDVIGVCWNLIEKSVFFTKNGSGLPIAFHQYSWFNLPLMIPIVGLRSEGETVEANFGKKFFEYDIETYFIQFTKHHMSKILFLGKLIFLKKLKKTRNDVIFTELNQSFFQKKIKWLVFDNIFKKKIIKNLDIFYPFYFNKKTFVYLENLDSILLSTYLKFWTKILNLCISKKIPENQFFISKVYSLMINLHCFLSQLMEYFKNFQTKSNYIKNFKFYLKNFFSKEKITGKLFYGNPYNLMHDQSMIDIPDIYQSINIWFEKRVLTLKKLELKHYSVNSWD